jgi:hypothetical protein
MREYFKVKVITIHKTPVYHVVNTRTNITESNWPTMEQAMLAMRSLNSAERAKARVA